MGLGTMFIPGYWGSVLFEGLVEGLMAFLCLPYFLFSDPLTTLDRGCMNEWVVCWYFDSSGF